MLESMTMRVSYVIFPFDREEEEVGYSIACVAGDILHPHFMGIVPFDTLNRMEEFFTKGLDYVKVRKEGGVPKEIINSFNEENKEA